MGMEDDLTLLDNLTLIDLCLSSKMVAYSILECELDPSFDYGRTVPGIALQVKNKRTGIRYDCVNNGYTSCGIKLL